MKSNNNINGEMETTELHGNQRPLTIIFTVLVIAGACMFLAGISGPMAKRIWQVYLVNFLFWSGISFGTVLFVAVLNMSNARWARPMKRLAEAPGAFLPIAFLLFWVLYFGRDEIFPWINEPVPGKEAWLNTGFLFVRNGIGLFLLTGLSLLLIATSVRMDVKAAKSLSKNTTSNGHDSQVQDKEMRKAWNTQINLSPIIGIMYALVMSLVAFDLIMSLDPHWLSTLFGAYYFIGNFYSALAALCLLSFIGTKYMGMEKFIRPKQFHDLGKLLLGFCLVTGDFFYSQFLVIWYGNLTEETQYVILRVRQAPWETIAWIVLALCFVGPFVVLLSRKIKLNPAAMALLGVVILGGMWMERYLLVAPSLWEEQSLPLGVPEILITAGYAGAMGLTVLFFLKKFPLLPISDPLYCEMRREAETENT